MAVTTFFAIVAVSIAKMTAFFVKCIGGFTLILPNRDRNYSDFVQTGRVPTTDLTSLIPYRNAARSAARAIGVWPRYS